MTASLTNFLTLSIHFPLTREDKEILKGGKDNASFNPLPSHEGRLWEQTEGWKNESFQSTSLSRGKTQCGGATVRSGAFQSTSLSRGKTNLELVPSAR